MYTFFMILLISLSILLVVGILIQQGKGDLGLGSVGIHGQKLFGGSGGADFLEKVTWTLGALFMLGCLGLAMLKKTQDGSRLKKFDRPAAEAPIKAETEAPTDTTAPEAPEVR